MTQAPLACLAIAPVSSERVFPPICISFLWLIFPSDARGHSSPRCCCLCPRWPNDGIRPMRDVGLLADAELVDDRPVALEVRLLEVVEKAAAAADELEKPAPAVVILRVSLEMLREIG